MVQGMGDDYQAGYSLNQGGWNWGNWFGGSGNPFMDIFAVTMANFRFQNFTGGGSMWNGFMGGGMGGFQMSPFGGAEYSFSTSGSGSSTGTKTPKTTEEKIADKSLKRKYDALKDLLDKYRKTLPEGTVKDTLDILFDEHGKKTSPKQEDYDALKTYYTENKDKIKTALVKTADWNKIGYESDSSAMTVNAKTLISEINNKNTTTYSVMNGDSLKSDIDVVDLMSSLNKYYSWGGSGKLFSEIWDDDGKRKTGITTEKGQSIYKLYKAIGDKLVDRINSIKDDSSLSENTKKMLTKALSVADYDVNDTSKTYNKMKYKRSKMWAMYFWLRIAEAEIMDAKYACLNEEFTGDGLIGEGAMVAAAKKDLYDNEGFSATDNTVKGNF